eukprot:3442614-Karenia_brevis.AAC.1
MVTTIIITTMMMTVMFATMMMMVRIMMIYSISPPPEARYNSTQGTGKGSVETQGGPAGAAARASCHRTGEQLIKGQA